MPLTMLKPAEDVKSSGDSLGGFTVPPSDAYDMVIKMAYMDESSKGAINVNLELANADGITIKEVIYISSGKDKGQRTFYEKDGVKYALPGYTTIQNIALLSSGKQLFELEPKTKTVEVYDYDQKASVPVTKPVLMELIGKKITVGVLRVIENKRKPNAAGVYVPTAETRTNNQIDSVFHPVSHLTVNEIAASLEEAVFFKKWTDKNKGKDRDKTIKVSGVSPTPAVNSAAAAEQTSTLSNMFNA